MAETSTIEWTDSTWNPITGCTIVSDGCDNCYAMKLAGGRMQNHHSRKGLTRKTSGGRVVWNGQVRFNKGWLDQPLRWKKPRRIFVCAHGDLFHESVPDEWIDKVFAVMALAPQHQFQVLTKRPERMLEYMNEDWVDVMAEGAAQRLWYERTGEDPSMWLSVNLPLPNVVLMTSAEDQKTADLRIPDLMETLAAKRGVSLEPLLGPIDISLWVDRLDWVIAGGESGPGARPMHPEWVRDIRDACKDTGTPFHFKQWGNWAHADDWGHFLRFKHKALLRQDGSQIHIHPDLKWHDPSVAKMIRIRKKRAGRRLDGVEHNGQPV